MKHKTHVDTVLGHRQRYLERFEKKEKNKRFLQYSEGVSVRSNLCYLWIDCLVHMSEGISQSLNSNKLESESQIGPTCSFQFPYALKC